MVAAEILVAVGGGAAFLAVGADEGAFGNCHFSSGNEKASHKRGFCVFRSTGVMGKSLFLPYIFRIPSPENKAAKYLWGWWLVSGLECGVVTLDFGSGA
jgi:hypothetical protein